MLKQRPAGDKSWPIACSGATLGTSLTAWGNSLIDWGNFLVGFTGADLTNSTDLGDSEIYYGSYGYYGSSPSVIDFSV
jgi:hypothetical protein